MDIDEFNVLFEQTMEKISAENKEIYLLGDFNIDLLKIEDQNKNDEFYNIICTNFLVPHITLPTRITSTTATLIDNIFSNNLDFTHAISGNLTATISDHLPQFLIVPKDDIKVLKKQNLFRGDKNYDKASLVSEFINIDWKSILKLDEANPATSFDNFNKKINEIIDIHLPLKKLSKKELKIQAKPWITAGIRNSIKRRDKLLRKFIKSKDEGKIKEDLYSKYKALRNKVVSLTRTSKKLHFQQYFAENSKDIKKTWSGIKNIINFRNANKGQPSSMFIDGEFTNDSTKIANSFNNYFSTVAEKLQGNIYSFGADFTDYLKNPSENIFHFESADNQEVLLIIDSLENNKASGPNSIPTEVLKLIKNNICYPLKDIINLSFATGIYPNQLKVARVIPIFKNKGDPLMITNYRPISLLSNINKIFEKIVYKRLYSYLNRLNCIYELQFGFRAKHSTNHALLSLTEKIREALDSGNFACGVFIDL